MSNHHQTSQRYFPAASSSIQKFDNDRDVIFMFEMYQSIVSIISHCESHALSENSAHYDVTLYATMF